MLFSIDSNCNVQGIEHIGQYRHVLAVVMLSWSYLYLMQLVWQQKSLVTARNKINCFSLLFLVCNCKLQEIGSIGLYRHVLLQPTMFRSYLNPIKFVWSQKVFVLAQNKPSCYSLFIVIVSYRKQTIQAYIGISWSS